MYKNSDIDYLKYLKGKDIYIFGSGKIGKQTCAKLKNYTVKGFIDNDVNKQGTFIMELPVCGLNDYLIKANENTVIVIAVNIHEKDIKEQLLENNVFNFISVRQIDFGGGEEYYDEAYFDVQRKMGEFGGKAKLKLFQKYISDDMTVVEFGCGGGYLLNNITAKEKLGIEVNDYARRQAEKLGVNTVKNIEDVLDDSADIIISTSVLEHTENPLGCIRELRKKLKDGGMAVFHVPNENCETEYQRSEYNNHLYTWNALNIGNLFKAAGYFVYSVERIQERWPNRYEYLYEKYGKETFEELEEICGRIYNNSSCIIVAYK